MLISTLDERWSQDERVAFWLRGIDAIDPDTRTELYASDGRRKTGRGTRYICRVPTGETRMGYLGTDNPRHVPVLRKAFTVTAHSEAEAIERANKALVRFLGKKPRWNDQAWNWVFDQPSTAALLRGE
jgi:hypothetical protein